MDHKKIQVLFGIFALIMGIGYLSCDESCSSEATDGDMYDAQAVCNDDGVCNDDETVMSCPSDCWDITQTTTCRAAYNETRMSCLDYTVDTDATEKTPMEIYQHIYDSCVQLGRDEQCQLGSEEECIFKVSQQYSCLQMACVDVTNYHICMIQPMNTENGQIMSLEYGVTTIPVFPYDAWTQGACNVMSGLDPNATEPNPIIKDDDLTCDLY